MKRCRNSQTLAHAICAHQSRSRIQPSYHSLVPEFSLLLPEFSPFEPAAAEAKVEAKGEGMVKEEEEMEVESKISQRVEDEMGMWARECWCQLPLARGRVSETG